MRSCPFCGEMIQDAAQKCRYCLEFLTDVSTIARSAQTPSQNGPPTQSTTSAPMTAQSTGSIANAIFWMFLLSLVLFFAPVLGPFIAGIVGGRKAGSFQNAILAAMIPSLTIATILLAVSSSLAGIPILGTLATFGALAIAFSGAGPLLIGAILGGAFVESPGARTPAPAVAIVVVFCALLGWRIYAQVQATARVLDKTSALAANMLGNTPNESTTTASSSDLPADEARNIAGALESYGIDHNQYPTAHNADDLRAALVPTYLREIRADVDAWTISSAPPAYRLSANGTVLAQNSMVVSHQDLAATESTATTMVDTTFTGTYAPAEPRNEVIHIPARAYTRSEHVEVGVLPYGDDVVHNGPPYGPTHDSVDYDFTCDRPGPYELWIEYAAAESRPVDITLNHDTIATALAETTGGWTPADQRFIKATNVTLQAGANTLRLFRRDVFPHLRTIEFRPTHY